MTVGPRSHLPTIEDLDGVTSERIVYWGALATVLVAVVGFFLGLP